MMQNQDLNNVYVIEYFDPTKLWLLIFVGIFVLFMVPTRCY
jgi:hypothetical protein